MPFFIRSKRFIPNDISESQNDGREILCKELNTAWGVWWLQDGSVDITQIDNEFHRVRYVDFETGELKHAFISFEEKRGVGSIGQLEYLRKSVVSLYPAEDHNNLENILELIQAHHIPPVSNEMEDLPQPVENNQESDMDVLCLALQPTCRSLCTLNLIDVGKILWCFELTRSKKGL